MKLAWIALITGMVPLTSALAELDLSPQPESFDLDGIQISQLAFSNGRLPKVSYQPPRDWKCTGGRDQLVLQPTALAQATAKIIKLPLDETIALNEAGREELKRKALLSLPEGSQDAEVISEELDPVQIDGLHTYRVEMKYVFFGEKFACYSLTVDRKKQALNFRLCCREKDYQDLRNAFEKSLCTWQNL